MQHVFIYIQVTKESCIGEDRTINCTNTIYFIRINNDVGQNENIACGMYIDREEYALLGLQSGAAV